MLFCELAVLILGFNFDFTLFQQRGFACLQAAVPYAPNHLGGLMYTAQITEWVNECMSAGNHSGSWTDEQSEQSSPERRSTVWSYRSVCSHMTIYVARWCILLAQACMILLGDVLCIRHAAHHAQGSWTCRYAVAAVTSTAESQWIISTFTGGSHAQLILMVVGTIYKHVTSRLDWQTKVFTCQIYQILASVHLCQPIYQLIC